MGYTTALMPHLSQPIAGQSFSGLRMLLTMGALT